MQILIPLVPEQVTAAVHGNTRPTAYVEFCFFHNRGLLMESQPFRGAALAQSHAVSLKAAS